MINWQGTPTQHKKTMVELLGNTHQVPFYVSLPCWLRKSNGDFLYLATWSYYLA